MEVHVKIVNQSHHPLPEYATPGSAGIDLRAFLKTKIELLPGTRVLIPTGLKISLPPGMEAQIRPRSGWALKYGITVLNSPGTIDSDYRGEIMVLLIHHGESAFEIQDGDRIAQLVIAPYVRAIWETSTSLDQTDRAAGGFGSTGKN